MAQQTKSGVPSGDTSSSPGADSKSNESGLAKSLKQDAIGVGTEIKGLASELADGAKKQAEGRLNAGRERVGGAIGSVAGALRDASTREGDEGLAPEVRPYVEKAAAQMEKVSDYVQSRGLMDIARDVEDFARREPALFLGGAFVLGLVGGRLLKASAPNGNHNGAKSQPRGSKKSRRGSSSAGSNDRTGDGAESARLEPGSGVR